MLIRLFYEKTKPEKPWTLKIVEGDRGVAHYGATHVVFEIPCETEEHPEWTEPQKFFVKAEGKIVWKGTVAHIVAE